MTGNGQRKSTSFSEKSTAEKCIILMRWLKNTGVYRNQITNSCKSSADDYKRILEKLRDTEETGNSEWAVHAMREHIRAIIFHVGEMEKLERAALSEINLVKLKNQEMPPSE